MSEPHNNFATLSFAAGSRENGKICLWAQPNSNESADCNLIGRERADELLAFMEATGMPFMLGHVMAAIVEGGQWGPMEIGFAHRLAEYALEGEIAIQKAQKPARPVLKLVEG